MNTIAGNYGTVLVVDHDPAVLLLIRTILAPNCRVLFAASGADALHLIRQEPERIDAAVIDTRMREAREAGFADELLALRPDMRIIWMRGFVDGEFIRIKLAARNGGLWPASPSHGGVVHAVEEAIAERPAGWDEAAYRGARGLHAAGASGYRHVAAGSA